GVGLGHEQIQQRALSIGLKLEAVHMIKELNAGLGQDRPGLVEDGGRVLAFLLVERALVRDPGAAGIAEPKFLGVARNALRVIPEPVARNMAANRLAFVLYEH